MKANRLLALPFILLSTLCFAAEIPADPALAAAARAAAQFRHLAILSPDMDGPSPLRWVVWGSGVGRGQAVDLALFRHLGNRGQGHRAIRLWSRRWPEGYLPRLERVPGWYYEERPVLVLIFQYGAALEHLELFGIDKQDRVVLLAAREASLFERRYGTTGWQFVAQQGTGEAPLCLTYRPNSPGLVEETCDGHGP